MTGLGDVAYTGPADPDESTIFPFSDGEPYISGKSIAFIIDIVTSKVVLDGLSITASNL